MQGRGRRRARRAGDGRRGVEEQAHLALRDLEQGGQVADGGLRDHPAGAVERRRRLFEVADQRPAGLRLDRAAAQGGRDVGQAVLRGRQRRQEDCERQGDDLGHDQGADHQGEDLDRDRRGRQAQGGADRRHTLLTRASSM
jgi:hypothetical protein